MSGRRWRQRPDAAPEADAEGLQMAEEAARSAAEVRAEIARAPADLAASLMPAAEALEEIADMLRRPGAATEERLRSACARLDMAAAAMRVLRDQRERRRA